MDAMTVLPRGREFTRRDLDAMPDDGNRYELIDGLLIVTPAPGFRHQVAVLELAIRLRAARPEGLQVLAIEVLSPSTRLYDINHKRARLERAGCPDYWVVDPDVPSVTAWTLVDGAYHQVAHAEADHAFEATTPFPITLKPVDLIGS